MTSKERYIEYTEIFPRTAEELRKRTFRPGSSKCVLFILENEDAILKNAERLAARKKYRLAADLLAQSCKLISEVTLKEHHRAWATKIYIQQILAMRGHLQKNHWRKVMKQRAKYLDRVLWIAEDAGVEAKALTELREWQARVADTVKKAEVLDDYRIAAQLLSRLGDAADLILMGKYDLSYAHLVETITALASVDKGGNE